LIGPSLKFEALYVAVKSVNLIAVMRVCL
jgi:hypothetical protein